MPQIVLTLGQELDGKFFGVPAITFVDQSTTPDEIILADVPYEAAMTDGAATLTLPASGDVTFNLIAATATGADPIDYYDPSTYKKVWDIHAKIPESASPIPAADLVATFFTVDLLDQSINAIADAITKPPYIDRLPVGLQLKGEWDNTTFYAENDLVTRDGELYRYTNAVQTNNKDPLDPANIPTYWELTVEKGAAGGTGANIIGYNHTTWVGQGEAAARSDVQAGVAYAIANSSTDLTGYAQLAGATFTGTVSAPQPVGTPGSAQLTPYQYNEARYARPGSANTFTGANSFTGGSITVSTPAYGSDNNAAASTAFVQAALAGLNRLPMPLVWASRAANQSFNSGSLQTISWDTEVADPTGILAGGGGLIPAVTAYYLLFMKLSININGVYSGNENRTIIRGAFYRTAPSFVDFGDFFQPNLGSYNQLYNYRIGGFLPVLLTAGETYSFGVALSGAGVSGSGHSIAGSVANNVILVWRLT